MFPWLKPELNQNVNHSNKNSESDKIIVAVTRNDQQIPNGVLKPSSSKIGSPKNPFTDNFQSNNFHSQSEKMKRNSVVQQDSKDAKRNGFNNFEDHQRQLIQQNKQDYRDFYKNNVSEFAKKQIGQDILFNEEKKRKLQQQYQSEEEQGVIEASRNTQSRRSVITPSISKEDYGDALRQQIEEKREIERLKRRKEEKEDFQNRFPQRNEQEIQPRKIENTEQISRQMQIQTNNPEENRMIIIREDQKPYVQDAPKKAQGKKNVGFEGIKDDDYDDDGRRQDYYFESQQENNQQFNFESKNPSNQSKQFIQEDLQRFSDKINEQPQDTQKLAKAREERAKMLQRVVLPNSRDGQIEQKQRYQEEENKKKQEQFLKQRAQQDIVDQMYEKETRDQDLRKIREMQYYKELEENMYEKKLNKPERGESSHGRNFSWSQKDKSLLDVIEMNYERKEEQKNKEQMDMADQLKQQMIEKKQKERQAKELEARTEREYEERLRKERQELQNKYERELQGQQLEIKSIKKTSEKKKQESILKRGESFVSNKSSDRNKSVEKINKSIEQEKNRQDMIVAEEPAENEFDKIKNNNNNNNRFERVELNDSQTQKTTKSSPKQDSQVPVRFSEIPLNDSQNYREESIDRLRDNALEQYKDEVQSRQLKESAISQNISQEFQPYTQLPVNFNEGQSASQYFSARKGSQQGYSEFRNNENNTNFSYNQSAKSRTLASRGYNQGKEWNPPPLWAFKDRKNEEELAYLRDQLNLQTSLLSSGVHKIKQDASMAQEMKSQAIVDLENLKDQMRQQTVMESIKLREIKKNLGNLGQGSSDILPIISAPSGSYGGLLKGNTRNTNSIPSLTQFYINNNNNNNKGDSYPQSNNIFSSFPKQSNSSDILDKIISQSGNFYRFEGSRLGNNPSALNLKLEKRLTNVNLSKADLQLLEVDNLLQNLKNGI